MHVLAGPRNKVRKLLEGVQSEQQREFEKNLIGGDLQKVVFKVVEPKLGFGGKVVMTAKGNRELSDCDIKKGSMVTLLSQYDTKLHVFVVEVGKGGMVVELEDARPALRAPDASWVLIGRTICSIYKRMRFVLRDMQRLTSGRAHGKSLQMWVGNEVLVRTLLVPQSPGIRYMSGVTFFDKNLNISQKMAVSYALGASRTALIHGPPGTGKTRSLVELIRQVVLRGERVLVCASSNVVVDHVMKAAYDKGVDCLRLGSSNSYKVDQETKQYYLDQRIKSSEEGIEIERTERERDKLLAGLLAPSFDDWDGFGQAAAQIRAKLAELGARAEAKVIPNAPAVFCTLTAAGGSLIAGQCFDVLIIDEANLALEPECWLAIAHCRKVILAGDVHQMVPILHHEESPLGRSFFGRLLPHFAAPSLNIQYRMHQSIMRFPASQHYASLLAHGSVKEHLLSQLPGVTATSVTTCPLQFINTAGHHLVEKHLGMSIENEGEAELAMAHVESLVAANVPPEAIAIICTHDAQVELMKRIASKYLQLAITNIDGALGVEREAVILSLVLSNPEHEIGYLRDYRRLNAAITRARRHLCVIGDGATFTAYPPYAPSFPSEFIYHLLEHAQVCCPGDYKDLTQSPVFVGAHPKPNSLA